MTRMQQYMQLVKYAELCWASYSEGLNEGMFGDKEKKWGYKEQGVYYTDSEIKLLEKDKDIELPTPTTKLLQNLIISFLKNTM